MVQQRHSLREWIDKRYPKFDKEDPTFKQKIIAQLQRRGFL